MDIEKPNCIGCHHIHPDNGNCTAVGGFCTAVPAANCPLIPELRAENEKMRAELEQVKACIYYKAGGFCRYGGDDPANVCVLGPCAHEVAAQKFIAEAAAEKGERDHPTPPEPLTQEQLREMVGHWVWVLVNYEHNGEAFQCDGWALVATPCRVAYLDQEFPVSELGTRFQAYTQPVSDFRVRFMNNEGEKVHINE